MTIDSKKAKKTVHVPDLVGIGDINTLYNVLMEAGIHCFVEPKEGFVYVCYDHKANASIFEALRVAVNRSTHFVVDKHDELDAVHMWIINKKHSATIPPNYKEQRNKNLPVIKKTLMLFCISIIGALVMYYRFGSLIFGPVLQGPLIICREGKCRPNPDPYDHEYLNDLQSFKKCYKICFGLCTVYTVLLRLITLFTSFRSKLSVLLDTVLYHKLPVMIFAFLYGMVHATLSINLYEGSRPSRVIRVATAAVIAPCAVFWVYVKQWFAMSPKKLRYLYTALFAAMLVGIAIVIMCFLGIYDLRKSLPTIVAVSFDLLSAFFFAYLLLGYMEYCVYDMRCTPANLIKDLQMYKPWPLAVQPLFVCSLFYLLLHCWG